jgi:hypothetical protein
MKPRAAATAAKAPTANAAAEASAFAADTTGTSAHAMGAGFDVEQGHSQQDNHQDADRWRPYRCA